MAGSQLYCVQQMIRDLEVIQTKYYELTKEGGMNFAYTKNGR